MLRLDGTYVMEQGQPRFRRVPPPTPAELEVSPQQGRKAFTLHAGVAVRGDDRKTLERLCRYITRPALAEGRLSLTPQGRVRYTLKTPYRDRTTHMVFAPLDFLARLAALVPKPRVHLTRYHGVFAPHSRWRAQITPAGRGSGATTADTRTAAERHRAMTWAQRLKRVFGCVEDPAVIGKILAHLATRRLLEAVEGRRPEVRGPPPGELEFG